MNVAELKVPNVRRAKRVSSRRDANGAAAVVIDNGSHELRAGFRDDDEPALRIPNQLIRPRTRWSTEFETLVGEHGFNVKGFDLGRAAVRSPFDTNVVVNFDTQEAILDYTFDRLGFEESLAGTDVVMTECLGNPSLSRRTMLELLFEGYGVQRATFVPDCLAAFHHNRQTGRCGSSAVIVCSGHSATHVVPVIHDRAHLQHAQRSKICGALATTHLQQLTMLHNAQCAASMSKQIAELMKEQCTLCSQDYHGDLERIAGDQKTAGGLGLKIQLPKSNLSVNAPPQENYPDREEDKAARAEENRQRLKAMSLKRKEKLINEKKEMLRYMKEVQQQVKDAESEEVVAELLEDAEVETVEELDQYIDSLVSSLHRLSRPEQASSKTQEVAAPVEEDIDSVRERYRELSERLDQRKRGRFGLDRDSGPSSKRVSSEQRRRMKLVAEAVANDDDDDFGADDRDWDVYEQMDPSNLYDADLDRHDEAELRSIKEKLQQMGDVFKEVPPVEIGHAHVVEQLDENQVYLSVERIRVPELLFQPSLMGIEQAGIAEIVSRVLQSLPAELMSLTDQEILLCGGNASYEGLSSRLEIEMQSLRPYGRPMKVVPSEDFHLDAWRGAARFSRSAAAWECSYALAEYEEYGPNAFPEKPVPFVHYM